MSSVGPLLVRHLADPTSSWSVGELGVLAEFHHHGPTLQPDATTVITGGGAIRTVERADIVPLAEHFLGQVAPGRGLGAGAAARAHTCARAAAPRRPGR